VSTWNIFNRNNIINSYCYINDSNALEEVSQSSLGVRPMLVLGCLFYLLSVMSSKRKKPKSIKRYFDAFFGWLNN
jgi:hypothetical protein